MVWDALFARCLHFFNCVIQKEVDQDGVDMSIRVLFDDLSAY